MYLTPTHPSQTLVLEGQWWMEFGVSDLPSIAPLTLGFMKEGHLACNGECLTTHASPHGHVGDCKAWMAAGVAHAHSLLTL